MKLDIYEGNMQNLIVELKTINGVVSARRGVEAFLNTYPQLSTDKPLEETSLSDLYNEETQSKSQDGFQKWLRSEDGEEVYQFSLIYKEK